MQPHQPFSLFVFVSWWAVTAFPKAGQRKWFHQIRQKLYLCLVTETWMMTDDNWTLPVHVDWIDQNDVAAVRLHDLPLLNIQHKALTAKLDSLGDCRDGTWWVLRGALETCAAQITGDPELELMWRPSDARVKYRAIQSDRNRADFFIEYARTGIINDPVKAEVVFVDFEKFMLSWMLNHQRPVSLGFCDLYAVPFRPNWKQLLYFTQQMKQVASRKLTFTALQLSRTTKEELIKRGTPDDLIDPKFIFWCKKDSHMYWSIEARPRNMWWRMVKAVEMAKKSKRRGAKYLESIGDTIKRFLPQALELYASHLQQISQPFIRLAASVRSSRSRFVQNASAGIIRPARFVSSAPAALIRREGGEAGVVLDDVSSAAFLSTMSDLQREKLAMRDTREDLARAVATASAGRPAP